MDPSPPTTNRTGVSSGELQPTQKWISSQSKPLSRLPGVKSTVVIARTSKALAPQQPQQLLRTLDSVRNQVIDEFVLRTIKNAQTIEGARVNVASPYAMIEDDASLRQLASSIINQTRYTHRINDYFFVITTGQTMMICGSSDDYIHPATLLISAKFLGRVRSTHDDHLYYAAVIDHLGESSSDEVAIWDIVRKCVRQPIDPLVAPPDSKSIDEILAEVRAKLQRITPQQAYNELVEPQVFAPTYLVDIRPVAQRVDEGAIDGSLIVDRNIIEWRFDPRCSSRLPIANRYDIRLIVFCQEGSASSLAVDSLQRIGLLNATDIIGGYRAWREANLPVELPSSRGPISGDRNSAAQ